MLVHEFLENSAKRLPDKIGLIADGQRLTYKQINMQAEQLSSFLVDKGIKRQERVIIFLDNSVESVISLFGILKAGAIFIMLNATMKSKKLNYIIKNSGASALITNKNKYGIVKNSIANTPNLKTIIWCLKDRSDQIPELKTTNIETKVNYSWDDVFAAPLNKKSTYLVNCLDIDLATIIYTSGSTGEPKGVMSSHHNVYSAAKSITTYLKNVEEDIIINTLPLSFDYGLYQIFMVFLFGGTLVLEKSFSFPFRVLERLVKEKASGFPIVPTMAALLFRMEELSEFNFSSLRYITNTAAALPKAYSQKLQKIFKNVQIYSMYGLTECKRVAYLPPEDIGRKPDSVGIAMPNEEVYIVDNKGEKVGPNVVGELVVRGANVMQGYWNSDEETEKRFRPGRYRSETLLYTGDLFRMDEEGYLYFIGRMDDMIKVKGERVSPKEIENCLCDMEEIMEAAVIGVPDEIFGQIIKAFVILKDSKVVPVVPKSKIYHHCQKNLESFMVPKYINIVDQFKKTSSGKIDKKCLS